MIVIYAEKPDMGSKIAAALDKITLSSGKVVTFNQLQANLKAVKAQQAKDGYLKIQFMEQPTIVTWGYGHLCTLKLSTSNFCDKLIGIKFSYFWNINKSL